MEHISHGASYPAQMVVDDAESRIVKVNMRLPGRAAGQIFAVIREGGSAWTKAFAYDPAITEHAIDFSDTLPPGFFYPGRSFQLEFREWMNADPLPVQFISTHAAAIVYCIDDAAGVQEQIIGIPFA